MPNQPFPNAMPGTLFVSVDEDEENSILVELADEFAQEIYEELEDAFPRYVVSPAVWPKNRKRLEKYLMLIVEAYPQDAQARLWELEMLLDTNYLDAYKMGMVPKPMSRPWNTLIMMPKIFRFFQSDLRDLYRTFMQSQVEQGPPPPPALMGGYA